MFKTYRILSLITILLCLSTPITISHAHAATPTAEPLSALVFVARAHLATADDIFDDELGPAGQFGTGLTKFAPGSKLVRRNADGTLFVYNTPGLVDLQSPDVNFAANKIVFAGATTLSQESNNAGWRLYEINVDGSGFRQLTQSDRTFAIPNADQFLNQREYGTYNDLFPAYLADGRIVFSSSRYPTRSHYDDRRTYNLYVINGDGSNLHRITSDRGGFLHPTPLPDGRILATRWWNQFNQPSETGIFNRIDNAKTDRTLSDGTLILANPSEDFNAPRGKLPDGTEVRDAPNTWHLMALDPDGTDLVRFAWTPAFRWSLTHDTGLYDTYHAAQPTVLQAGGTLYVAYTSQQDSTMVHSTLKTGIRVARPGVEMLYANATDAIAGLTYKKAWQNDDESGPYAIHPWGLPDGRILYSQSSEDATLPATGSHSEGAKNFPLQGSKLRYELYTMSITGTEQSAVAIDLASIGSANADVMDAKPIVARTGWATRADEFTAIASDDPRLGNLPKTMPEYAFSQRSADEIQTATLHNPNVYANAGLNTPFVNNSPPPGSVAFAEIWVDANQFTGANCYNDWPQPCATFRPDNQIHAVLWGDTAVTPQGAFTISIPADTPSFIVLRDAQHRIVRKWERGYLSIAQGNAWARPGETVTCVGCHMGHVSGSLEGDEEAAKEGWSNVAPYATVTASSFFEHNDPEYPEYKPFRPRFVNDRRGWVPVPTGGPVAPDQGLVQFQRRVNVFASQLSAASIHQPENGNELGSTYQDDESSWISAKGKAAGEWVSLTWSQPLIVKTVRLVSVPAKGGDWKGFGEPAQHGDYHIESGTLQLFLKGVQVGGDLSVGRVAALAGGGTLLNLAAPVEVDQVRFTVGSTNGRWWWENVAALSEIEVIGVNEQAVEAAPPLDLPNKVFLPVMRK